MLLLKSFWRLWQSIAPKASAALGPTLVPLGEFSASWFRECVSLEWETVLFPNARVLVNLYFLRVLLLCSLSSSHFLSMNVSHAARSQLAPSVFCPENSLARCLYSESYVPYCQLCRRQYGLLFYYCLAGIASNGSLLPSLQLVTNGDSHISTLLPIQSQRHHFQAFVLSHFTFRCH